MVKVDKFFFAWNNAFAFVVFDSYSPGEIQKFTERKCSILMWISKTDLHEYYTSLGFYTRSVCFEGHVFLRFQNNLFFFSEEAFNLNLLNLHLSEVGLDLNL